MNIIVSNKQKNIIDNVNIDAIKELNGLFNVDDLISKLKNYFFNRVILDATSVVNFTSEEVLTKLAQEIGSERLVILLPNKPEPPREFVKRLNDLKINNFSNNIDDVVRMLNNNENDVNDMDISNNFYTDNNIDINDNTVNNLNGNDDMGSIENNYRNDMPMANGNSSFNMSSVGNRKIIGFKNVTSHAGSTTLAYLLYKIIKQKLHKDVLAVEVNKNDFIYYNDINLVSVKDSELKNVIKESHAEIVLIDLNNCEDNEICNEILYLIEPSIIKLNQLMLGNRVIFRTLNSKKIILNKSMLSLNDVEIFSNEAGVAIYFNIPPLNDRADNEILLKLLKQLEIN